MTNPASAAYGPIGLACLAFNCILTKAFCRRVRLIRFPLYCRGRKHVYFGSGVTLGRGCRIDAWNFSGNFSSGSSYKVLIEDRVQIGDRVQIAAACSVWIGSDTLIASNVFISDHDHGSSDVDSLSQSPINRPLSVSGVSIGHSCWIGQNVCILKGVQIGDSSIIAAGAVVTRSFPANSVVAGVPARLIKTI